MMQTLNNITVTANTSQAVDAVRVLNNQWTEMNNAVGMVGRALGAAGGMVQKFVAVGGKIEDVNDGIQAISRYGLGKGILEGLRQETADVVDQMVLAQNAAKLLGSGAVQSVREMADAYKWAVTAGDQIGISADEAVSSITDALIGGRSVALQKFGIQMELVGTKAEKSAQIMQMIQKEIKFSDDAFAVTAGDFGNKMDAMKNSMLDAVEGLSLFRKGFDLISGSVEWVTKKLKKSSSEIWSDVESAGKMGLQKLQDDVAKTVAALNAAKVSGDTTSVDFLQKKLDKAISDGQAFLLQFNDLYEQFGKTAKAAEPFKIREDISQVLDVARKSAQDVEADIDMALRKIQELEEKDIQRMKRKAIEDEVSLTLQLETLRLRGHELDLAQQQGERKDIVIKKLELQDRIRADIQKTVEKTAEKSNMVYLLQQGQDELLRRKDRILSNNFSTLLKSLDAEKKTVEERRKYGRLMDNGVAAEKNLETLKKGYVTILEGQLKIAQQLNDQARTKYLIESKEKAEAIRTLADLEEQLKGHEDKKEEKRAEARIDEEKQRMAFLKQRLALMGDSEIGVELSSELQKEIEALENLARLYGAARESEKRRLQAIKENEEALQKIQKESAAASEKQAAENQRLAEESNKIADNQFNRIKILTLEQTKIVEQLKQRYSELQQLQMQSGDEGLRIINTLEAISLGAEGLSTKIADSTLPAQHQMKAYTALVEQYAVALRDGDRRTAESVRLRIIAMREEATAIEEISRKGMESERQLIFAQYAQESLRQQIEGKELQLKVALRDKSLERAAALRDEITALQQQAEVNGQALHQMERVQKQYQSLGAAGTAAIDAISRAAWADKAALEKYHGSRLKMAQEIFSDAMRKKAIEETVAAMSTTGQALWASVFAPPAAPPLWASAAQHAAAAAATGMLSYASGGGKSTASTGGMTGSGSGSGGSARSGFETVHQEQKTEVIINVTVGARDGWVGNIVDAIIDEQRRGKARRGIS